MFTNGDVGINETESILTRLPSNKFLINIRDTFYETQIYCCTIKWYE